MTLADIPDGEQVFLDANIFVYNYGPDPTYRQSALDLLVRVETGQVDGCSATHILSETAHRLMTTEAMELFKWKQAAVGKKLRQSTASIQALSRYRTAIATILASNCRILTIDPVWIAAASTISHTYGLLSNDALTVAAMDAHGVTALASNDSDFDRVPHVRRYAAA